MMGRLRIAARRKTCHLSGGFNSFPYAEVDDDPGEEEAEGEVPLDRSHVRYALRDLEHLTPEANDLDSQCYRQAAIVVATIVAPAAATLVTNPNCAGVRVGYGVGFFLR